MKKTRLIAGMLAVSMAILMSSTLLAHATVYYVTWGIRYTPKANVWQISTVSPVDGTMLFSGKEVDASTIVATIWHYCDNTPGLHDHPVEPRQVVLTDKLIILVFDKATLPASAQYTVVTGALTNGDSFSAQGPSFVLCLIGC